MDFYNCCGRSCLIQKIHSVSEPALLTFGRNSNKIHYYSTVFRTFTLDKDVGIVVMDFKLKV